MRSMLFLAASLTVAVALPAHATEVVRLSDAQREAVITAAANGPEKTPVLTPEQSQRQSVLERSLYPEFYSQNGGPAGTDRKVHGEMSVFAGSGGTFGMSGTAIMPLGESGTAAVSVMQGTSRFGGISGFSLGYASGGAQAGFNRFGGGLGNYGGGWGGGFGGPGQWATPNGRAWMPGMLPR